MKQSETRQDKTVQCKIRHDYTKPSQDNTRQGKAIQHKTRSTNPRYDTTVHTKTKSDDTIQ